ncbi:glycosyltransferase family 41 protein [Wolfiporia cocos MD-104 SS10]|uniref:protein O-GlcNAc transferase n=1 Tax=Wolfiporia cocos (strain MD-104) TaxID=742152 RepID=A0A2H3IUH4_WOLCO|nr:glycosyltransferase family 41 protein [Wolfiporia cocos MD-104 SS10]
MHRGSGPEVDDADASHAIESTESTDQTAYFRLHRQGWDPKHIPTPSLDPGSPSSSNLLRRRSTSMQPTARPLLSSDTSSGITLLSDTPEYASEPHDPHSIDLPSSDSSAVITAAWSASMVPSPTEMLHSNPFATTVARDAAIAYAYHLYDSPHNPPPAGLTHSPLFSPNVPALLSTENTFKFQLIPLLNILRALHPDYLPILLLLSCTHFALGDYHMSLQLSQDILTVDPTYVEAMSNIGTTYKALGCEDEAFQWWRKALQVRPTYWDAMDNILEQLFARARDTLDEASRSDYYAQALETCQFVQRKVLSNDGIPLLSINPPDIIRLQRAYLTTAAIHALRGLDGLQDAIRDYCTALEFAVRPPPPIPQDEHYTTRELILAACVAGYILTASSDGPIPPEVVASLDKPGERPFLHRISEPPFDVFRSIRASGDRLLDALLHIGGGVLPTMLLIPEQIMRLPMILFPCSTGILPATCTRDSNTGQLGLPARAARQKNNLMTSTIILSLAKKLQDDSLDHSMPPGFGGALPVSTSLVIFLYYLALALSPSPSTYNNLGILMCTLSSARTIRDSQGQRQILNGMTLARLYYQAGLQMDPNHPHLLTNLGSLLKDQGHINEAIELYMKAVQRKPDFDIALANLGNAVKDLGRSWDAIEYYRRAVSLNPNLPEATCGLVNSLCAVCDWRGRGAVPGELGVDEHGHIVLPNDHGKAGWITQMIEICQRQIDEAYAQNVGVIEQSAIVDEYLQAVEAAYGRPLCSNEKARWETCFRPRGRGKHGQMNINEAGIVLRFIDWVLPRLQRQWYLRAYGKTLSSAEPIFATASDLSNYYRRPTLPANLKNPPVPSVLPFHTFTYPLAPRMVRLIAHRNALRISYTAHSQTWLPEHVFRPPPPPVRGKLNIGYISNDVNDHPLSHLMQSVFNIHDRNYFSIFLYTTSPWDGSDYRPIIASRVENFVDASSWSTHAIVEHIVQHNIHILVNLGGYTKGSRNDIFAIRPCPIQIQLMGYAGTLSAGWCDYLVGCKISSPSHMSAAEVWRRSRESHEEMQYIFDFDADADPESSSDSWIYSEKLINIPHSFMVTDHKQSFRGDEQLSIEERAATPVEQLWRDEEARRVQMRQRIFPDLPQDVVIFANFNQLRLVQTIFTVWLNILIRVPHSILWLLRFPAAGEEHLLRAARAWAGEEVAARIRFTSVASKDEHVYRSRVADLFLDTMECNAHTIAADILWSGTPILTFLKHQHKMCSRVAASMASATGFGRDMVVDSIQQYENRAVALASSVQYVPARDHTGGVIYRSDGILIKLRRNIFLNRDNMPLFDTMRWTRNWEKGLREAWKRWVEGTQYEMSDEWEACRGPEKQSGCIWITDDEPANVVEYD